MWPSTKCVTAPANPLSLPVVHHTLLPSSSSPESRWGFHAQIEMKGSPALRVHTCPPIDTPTFLNRACLKSFSSFERTFMQVLLGNQQASPTLEPAWNECCLFYGQLKFFTYKFSQALEFCVEILNFSKMTSANIVFPAKLRFFLFKTNVNLAWFLLSKKHCVTYYISKICRPRSKKGF